MESSINSTSQPFSSCDIESNESSEESGWTNYFEDFLAQKNNHEDEDDSHGEVHGPFSSDFSSSIVSDAASSIVVGKLANNENHPLLKSPSSKKRKNMEVRSGNDLEDTASSLANNPEEKSSYGYHEERNEVDFSGRNCEDHDEMKLKKKELCVVPLSLVPNYLG